ncbi:sensor histidine kinase KdpD [Spirosoma sp. KNUC1025]|uniref:sensor histidine kinase n=1 Tax=Spirosoma sp. KNUC1025 TaxID=2894082 RepID=UPI003866FE61|nr:HAMP domain-containing histidine kinase [Spirosoma sp. KNUC1025]
MSLLGQTARYLLFTALAIALVGSVGFYVIIHRTIQREIDEILTSQSEQAIKQLHQYTSDAHLPTDWDDNPHVERLSSKADIQTGFVDILAPDPLNSANQVPMRQLRAVVTVDGEPYQVIVSQPYYEFDELAKIMSAGVILGFLVLMIASVVVGLGLARRLWRPFYGTIEQLRDFRLDAGGEVDFPESRIREFALLRQSLIELTRKLRQQFSLQKQFTENASHELQTPLAVASAELDFLMQSDQLTEADHAHLQQATNALSRLSQLNRSLLLLTQVENDQFTKDERLNLSALLNQYVDEYEPFFQYKNLMLKRNIAPDVLVQMNRQLAGVLLTNILKNAARHGSMSPGTSEGFVCIELTDTVLTIANTGEPLPFADSQLFDRFVKNPARPDSTGLGLALVKQITDRYGLPLTYRYDNHVHSFRVGLLSNGRSAQT